MLRIALSMLFGDRNKYLTLITGVAFATLLINQQAAIFMGLLLQATGMLQNVTQGDLWVTDGSTRWIGDVRSLSDQKLGRVRSVPGVEWAEPVFSGWAVAELPSGGYYRVQIIGLPRATLVGGPPAVTTGSIEDLRAPDAVIVEESSRRRLNDCAVGDVLKLNDRRAVVAGFCRAKKGFESNAIVYTTYDKALTYTPVGRETITFILVKVRPDADVGSVGAAIDGLGDVSAVTPSRFRSSSIDFIIRETGIGVNFFITIVLGMVVGLTLSGSILYQFTVENLRYYATLKALGAGGAAVSGMMVAQVLVVALVGYGLGIGGVALFTLVSRHAQSELSVFFPWQLAIGSFTGVVVFTLFGSLVSLRRVVRVPPAMIFGG